MATCIYNPLTGTYTDQSTGLPIVPGPADTRVYGNAATPYTVTATDGPTAGLITLSGDATFAVPSGVTVNAPIDDNGAKLLLGTAGATTTATVTGLITTTGASPYQYGLVSLAGNVNAPTGLSVNVNSGIYLQPSGTLSTGGYSSTDGAYNVLLGNGALIQLEGTFALAPVLSLANFAILMNPTATAGVQFSGGLVSGSAAINLVNKPNFTLFNPTLQNYTIASDATAKLVTPIFQNSTILGTIAITSTSLYGYSYGDLSGPGTIDVFTSFGVADGSTVDPLTIKLEPGALLYGTFGVSTVNITIAAGSVIEAVAGGNIAFDSHFANTMTLHGTLELLPVTSSATLVLSNTAGSALFAADSTVTIGTSADLKVQTTLDNETTIRLNSGTIEFDQAASHFGTVQFYATQSVLQLGTTGGTRFATTGTLLDLSATDTIVIGGAAYGTSAHVGLSGTTLTIVDNAGSLDATFTLARSDAQAYAIGDFTLSGTSTALTLTLSGIAAPGLPVVTAGGTASTATGAGAVTLDATVALADAGSPTLNGASVLIGGMLHGDILSFTPQSGITGSYNATSGQLTLSGAASIAAYRAALASVAFATTPGIDPTAGDAQVSRTISWTVTDPHVTSIAATSTLSITPAAPALTAGATAHYTAYAAPVLLDPALSLTDIQTTLLAGAEVIISGGSFTGALDLLAATTAGTNITADFYAYQHALYLVGADTLANYQAVLRSVTFSTLGGDPTNAGGNTTRSFTWLATDGALPSNLASSTATIVACFAAGTRLATPNGPVAVENLRRGDRVLSAFGGAEQIQWIGHRDIDCTTHSAPAAVWPVRVRAHALAAGVPTRDVWLSRDHAVFVDGVLMPIGLLANGASIVQEKRADIRYYHIELASHGVMLADGLPVESYLDTGNRTAFVNASGPTTLHPDFAGALREARTCAPHVTGGLIVERLRNRIMLQKEGFVLFCKKQPKNYYPFGAMTDELFYGKQTQTGT